MGRTAWLREWAGDLLDVIYPRCCEVCGAALVKGEEALCTKCDYNLPRCDIHRDSFNTLHQRLAGHAPIERAAGYFYYHRGSAYTRLIHVAKYDGRPCVARRLAENFAAEIAPDGFFDGIDMVVPVPLHRSKQLSRGYNQSAYIARGLCNAIGGLTFVEALRATRKHVTQTRKSAFDRWLNSADIYEVADASALADRHVLVVDDVITTGATMLACCEAIHRVAPSATISVLSLAVTALD